MTEPEWLAATNPSPMLEFLKSVASDRKLQMFAVAGIRHALEAITKSRRALRQCDAAERFADGLISVRDLRKQWTPSDGFSWPERAFEWADGVTAEQIDDDRSAVPQFVALLRDIFGNPFRPVAVDPAWLTSTVVALAEGVYQDRAVDRLPILADALQDAGCDNDDVLNHCRQPGEHVRGCWVVDLLTGRR